jgi:hypothetical protein
MTQFIARHSVVIFAVASALLGLGMRADGIWQIHQYETHRIAAAE